MIFRNGMAIQFVGAAVFAFALMYVTDASAHVFREPGSGCYDQRATASGNLSGTDPTSQDGHECAFVDNTDFSHTQVTSLYVDLINLTYNGKYISAAPCLQPNNGSSFSCGSTVNSSTSYGGTTINLSSALSVWQNSSYATYYAYVSIDADASGSNDLHELLGVTASAY